MRAVQFVHVADGRFKDGVNAVEAKRVAALVMEHARETPDQSLGGMGCSCREIEDALLAASCGDGMSSMPQRPS